MAGKKRTISALVVVGNGNGVAGFGVGRGEESFAAIRKVIYRYRLPILPRLSYLPFMSVTLI